jgi:hypothetical protein
MQATRATALAIILVGTVLTPPAGADEWEFQERVYDGTFCVEEKARIGSEPPDGRPEATVTSKGTQDKHCDVKYPRSPHHLTQKILLLYRPSANGQESLCAASVWLYNSVKTASWQIFATFDPEKYCGHGEYQTMAVGYAWNGDDWKGGSTTSPWRKF